MMVDGDVQGRKKGSIGVRGIERQDLRMDVSEGWKKSGREENRSLLLTFVLSISMSLSLSLPPPSISPSLSLPHSPFLSPLSLHAFIQMSVAVS